MDKEQQDHAIERTSNLPTQSAFSGIAAFEAAQRMATCLSKSDMVPDVYKGNLPNCIIALEMSQRLGMNPLQVMQSLDIIYGKPSWRASFLVACINGSGRFSPLRYEMTGEEGSMKRACRAWAVDRSGERLDGPRVSTQMAKDEGWIDRKGSKWKTMPELMLMYRAATLFARLYAPELAMGMQTSEEIIDIEDGGKAGPDILSPGRYDLRKNAAKEHAAKTEDAVEVSTENDAFAELAKLANENPMEMQAAIEAAREKNPSLSDVLSWDDVDAGNVMQCRVILAEFKRLRGK